VNSVYIIIGGNLGNKSKNLEIAHRFINLEIGEIERESGIYETEPWGFEDSRNFFNQVIKIKTQLSPSEILERIKKIESRFGRSTGQSIKYQSRQMDMDILFFNDNIIKLPGLTIPHPRLHERNFVLAPLCELAADFVHPVFNQTIRQLRSQCKDKKWIRSVDE
jgi:2-amino-4-hydroxy-6-hydroxymethyldihydropteridine diphosphokinase